MAMDVVVFVSVMFVMTVVGVGIKHALVIQCKLVTVTRNQSIFMNILFMKLLLIIY